MKYRNGFESTSGDELAHASHFKKSYTSASTKHAGTGARIGQLL
jgi:hypothetical protein